MHRRYDQLGFIDQMIGPGRTRSDEYFRAIDQVVDWGPIEERLGAIHSSTMGRPSITPLLLFKVLLIERWYNLSDVAAEDALNDRKSFARFVGLPLDQPAPDHSSISRFRTELAGRGLMASLTQDLMVQIEASGLVLKEGTLMDATFVRSAARPPSAPRQSKNTVAKPAAAPQREAAAGKRSRVDPDARWARKGRQAHFGYKLHLAADQERRIVRAHRVTVANVNDCTIGPELVQPDGGAHYADKGYPSEPLRRKLTEHGLADGIMQLGNKHYPLAPAQRRRNRLLAGIRCKVEGIFAEMKRRLGLARARYFGLTKVQLECDLVVFAFNLKTMALAAKSG
jgi:IS5 family transposase